MKFSIQEEGQEKQIFLTFKEASSATGIPSKVILRVLNSAESKYVRRADKKVFWIQKEETEPFIQVEENPRDLWTFPHSFLQSTPEEKNSLLGFAGEIS